MCLIGNLLRTICDKKKHLFTNTVPNQTAGKN